MVSLKKLTGGCRCGRVTVEFGTSKSPGEFNPRACDCSFCLKHGASYVSDANGRLSIEVRGSDALSEYRHGSGSARFLVCRHCGVLVAVLYDGGGISYGTVNSRCIEEGMAFGAPQTVSPKSLTAEEKRQRWTRLWTPNVALKVSST